MINTKNCIIRRLLFIVLLFDIICSTVMKALLQLIANAQADKM
jgi:hypothetical protein